MEDGEGGGVVFGFVDPDSETLAAGRVATRAAKAGMRENGKDEKANKWFSNQEKRLWETPSQQIN